MIKQFHAGYILSSIKESLKNHDDSIDFDNLLKHLSTFDIEFDFDEKNQINSIFSVLNNLISRGLPTFPSIFIENALIKKLKIGKRIISDKTGDITYRLYKKINEKLDLIYKSLFIVDQRIDKSYQPSLDFNSWEKHPGSEYEEIFYNNVLQKIFGEYSQQLIESQREISTILKFSGEKEEKFNKNLGEIKNSFYNQRVDFSFQFPNSSSFKNGLVIEIDGSQHNEPSQITLDKKRDEAVEKNGWDKTIRIKTSEIDNIESDKIESILNFLEHPYAKKIKENFENKIWEKEWGLKALQIALTPLSIARIQKTLIFLIENKALDLKAKKWNIAIIERDVPCGFLAIKDFKILVKNLFDLEGKRRQLPKINLKIYYTPEFTNCILNSNVKTELVNNPINNFRADVVLDLSILQRTGFSKIEKEFVNKVKYNKKVVIRSVHSIKINHTIKSAKPIKYKIPKEEQPKPLVYFLRNIFRKNAFLPGQVDILRRSLRFKDIIALLPTGAGKSLTYQLSALLQPGVVMIVDPLISLMRDQKENLKDFGIDSTVFINSSLRAIERNDASEKMVKGFYQFIFISPERLQIAKFRKYLSRMDETKFTYVVVDEAHCVSEWGHDFRTAYLRLGKNARKYCHTLVRKRNSEGELKDEVPIIALTGTASFDVLKDVKIELGFNINDESSIVRPLKYERKELEYRVIKTDDKKNSRSLPIKLLKETVADKKQEKLFEILNNLPNLKWDNGKYENLSEFFDQRLDYKNSGIVFCPHAKWIFGVKDIYYKFLNINKEFEDITSYYASKLSDEIELEKIQDQFKKDELLLLVSTNAFGMGIDKPNIRFTIHFNMPQSIESFYQEAGRAGRDKNKAYNFIIYSDTQIKEKFRDDEETHTVDKSFMLSFFYNSFRGEEKEKRILYNLFDKIAYPDKRKLDKLIELVEENFDEDIKFATWFKNGDRLYVNGPVYPKGYGYIDLNTEECKHQNIALKKILDNDTKAKNFVERVYQFLIKQKRLNNSNKNISFKKWILSRKSKDSIIGIEKTLNGMKLHIPTNIYIGFKNKDFQEVAEILGENDTAWDEDLVSEANGYAFKFDDFKQNLERVYYNKTNKELRFSPEQLTIIDQKYKSIRDKNDTFKAVYRLSIIGVIDDYEVDYKYKIITAKISKKTDEEYIENIKKYKAKYAIKDEINKVKQDILNTEGNTILQKCCNYLIDYVYETIAKKRKNAIDTMEDAIVNGFDNLDYFKSQINTYFDSKYLPELSSSFKENKIETVWYFISEAKDVDSLKHLEGACRRLLDDNPDSPILILLRSYSRFLLDINIEQTKLDFAKAWDLLKEQKNWSRNEYMKNFSKFYVYIIKFDKSMEGYLNPILLNEHKNWFKTFNKKIVKGVL
ncbi:MAG: RecQ family ATP-dependent DNA helicase [Candidatus Cloacimonetes bacterium]|nr:RecQ family ATP-dependent DNA helicase [Candidatus Cloacimonadota bacterium]MCK4359774.1 RecQ family ATP-dependent DNA helicase [Candidatus Cloacimonadota bacterium]